MLLILAVMGLLVVAIPSVGAEDVQTANLRDQGAPSGVAGEALQLPPTAEGRTAIARHDLSDPEDVRQLTNRIGSLACDCWGVPVSLLGDVIRPGFNAWVSDSSTTAAELFVDLSARFGGIKAIWVWDGSIWDLCAVFGVPVTARAGRAGPSEFVADRTFTSVKVRREGDSNPRDLAAYALSKRAHSAGLCDPSS